MTVKLVVSDCDGTLVTPDKKLTASAREAVARLHAAGIGFTITSSRPPFGMRMLIEPCDLRLPFGAFNGSSILDRNMTSIAHHTIPTPSARRSLDILAEFGVDAWVFTNDTWFIARDGDYVAHEQRTIETAPTIALDLTPHLDRACKIVGASADAGRLARCESAMKASLGDTALVARSQSYYLDVTPPGQDKGRFVDAIAARLGVAMEDIATLGDMRNDLPMFRRSGTSVAMGNAPDDVKAEATFVSASNADDGFAKAIARLLGD